MNELIIQRSLAYAQKVVEQGERHLLRQREIVTQLRSLGCDQTMALRLLTDLEACQVQHIEHRNKLVWCDGLRSAIDLSQRLIAKSGPEGPQDKELRTHAENALARSRELLKRKTFDGVAVAAIAAPMKQAGRRPGRARRARTDPATGYRA